jgi:excisionase family DNA binding protein
MPSPKTHTFAPDSLLTSYQVGTLLQVNPSSVNKWVKDGRIPAYRTPGGHRRIRATDLMTFLVTHKMPVPKGLTAQAQSVLAISDDHHLFDSLKQALAKDAHTITLTTVTDSIDGLMQVSQLNPHVVVLGPTIAPLDSLDVCRRLKAAPRTAHIRVVMVLDAANHDGERRALQAGAQAAIVRPIDTDNILRLLRPTAGE